MSTFVLHIHRDEYPMLALSVGSKREIRDALRTYPPGKARGGVVAVNGEIIATSVHSLTGARWSVVDERICPYSNEESS